VADLIPSYMVPELIVVRAEIPLTRNAKPDRAAVAALLDTYTGSGHGGEPTAPRNALEQVLLTAWRDVLDDQSLGVEDEFLTRGGDSVLAARIVAGLREALQSDRVRVRDVFTGRTVAAMAAAMLAEEPNWTQIAEIALEVAALSDADIEHELEHKH
jgi:mycobactin phenyloxazoline synthetase